MNCNCISEVKDRIKSELPQKNETYSKLKIKMVVCEGACLLSSKNNRLVGGISIPFTIVHEPVGRKKETTVHMTAKYCPFCGKATEEAEEE